MKLSEKLFALIQDKYANSDTLSRTVLRGLSAKVNEDLLAFISDNPDRRVYDKAGTLVPIILIVDDERIIYHLDNNGWCVRGHSTFFSSRAEALAEYRRSFQDGYKTRGWGCGGQNFAVRVRNDDPSAPVVFLAAEQSDLNASITTTTTTFGFNPAANDEDGCGYFLDDEFYLSLLPKVECEPAKQWPTDYAKLLKPIYEECTSPDQAWSLLEILNAAADQSDTISAPILESIFGLPNSSKTRVSVKTLQEQTTLMSSMSEMLASIERDAFFARLEDEFSDDPDPVHRFKNHILESGSRSSIEASIFATYAGKSRSESVETTYFEPWWSKFTIDILEHVLPGRKSNLSVDVMGQSAGDFSNKKMPIVANSELTFAFHSDITNATVSVFRAKTSLETGLPLSEGFNYSATDKDTKPFKLVFEASNGNLDRPSRTSHDIIMLDKLDSGCFVTIDDQLQLKKASPFSPSRKNAKYAFVSRIVALKETNVLIQIFTGAEFVLDENSIQAVYEDDPTPRQLNADQYNRYFGMRCDLVDGVEIHFSGRSKGKRCTYVVEVRVEQKETDSQPTVFDLLRNCHLGTARINVPVSFESGTISSRLSQEHITAVLETSSSVPVGYPLLVSDDISQFNKNGWLDSLKKFTKKIFQTVDPRPDIESWKRKCRTQEAENYFIARKQLFAALTDNGNTAFGGSVIEEFELYKISKEEHKGVKTLLTNYLQSYCAWLLADYETAITIDTIWAFFSDSDSLSSTPDAVFLLPQHPIRLYWQFQAQRHMYDLLSDNHHSSIVSSFDSHSNPDVLYLPLLSSTTGKSVLHAYFAVPTSSDYWGAFHSYSPILSSGTFDKSSFFQNWGFGITSVKRTMSAGEVESAINATQSVCIAKDALNVRYVSKNMGGNSARMLLRQGLDFLVGKDNDGPTFGPRMISIVGPRASAAPDGVTEAEIMNAREQTDGRLQWYAESGNERNRIKVDVTIASLGAANISAFRMDEQPSYGVVSAGGLLRYRNRSRGVGTASEIIESRTAQIASESTADEEDNVFLGVLQILEGRKRWLAEAEPGHVRFNADIVGAGIMRPDDDSSHYYAISSSDVDQACFESLNGNAGVYLWEYRLPMPGVHASGTDGFYLLAKENPTMIQAVSEAVKSLNPDGVDDDEIRKMLFSSAKRGIPTVKNLASGGKNALGEVGVLVTLNLLQGRLLDDASKGLLPAQISKDGFEYYNILVPMDVFRERFESLVKEVLGEKKKPTRPDVVCFSIKCRQIQEKLFPVSMRLSFIEIKTRKDSMSEAAMQEALEQANVIQRLYAEPATSMPRLLNWGRLDFLVGMLTFGFRVYESVPTLLKPLVSLYPKVIALLFENEEFMEVNPLPRLSVIHDIPQSRLSMKKAGVNQVIEISKEDGYLIATGIDTCETIKPIGNWGLLPEGVGVSVPEVIEEQSPTLSEGEQPSESTAVSIHPPQTDNDAHATAGAANEPVADSGNAQNVISQDSENERSLLDSSAEPSEDTEEKYAESLQRIREAFDDFGIVTERMGPPIETPNFILIDYKGTPTCTKARIAQKKEEFLSTYGIDLHQIDPRRGVVRLVLKRDKRAVLQMAKVWSDFHYDFESAKENGLLVAIEEDTGKPIYLNPQKESSPHTLVAGATGSGKSVLLLNMLYCLKDRFSPDEVKVVIMDPKQVDFIEFGDVPSFEIVSDKEKAVSIFNGLVDEMERRYALFRQYRVKKIAQLNALTDAPKIPTIWCFHDEFPDWFMDEKYQESAGIAISKLSAKARAAGIYLVFAAQRPEASVMPPFMRSNFGIRLVLKVADKGTSNIALGDANNFAQANELLGKGHMIAVLSEKTVFCQVPNVEE